MHSPAHSHRLMMLLLSLKLTCSARMPSSLVIAKASCRDHPDPDGSALRGSTYSFVRRSDPITMSNDGSCGWPPPLQSTDQLTSVMAQYHHVIVSMTIDEFVYNVGHQGLTYDRLPSSPISLLRAVRGFVWDRFDLCSPHSDGQVNMHYTANWRDDFVDFSALIWL